MPLLRGIARTAAIAGTATAVSNRVSRRQGNRWARQQAQEAPPEPQAAQRWGAEQQGYGGQQGYGEPQAAPPPPAAPVAAAPAAPAPDPTIQRLQELANLKSQGVLTEEEFAQQKSRILAG
jgi:hypothetical protein